MTCGTCSYRGYNTCMCIDWELYTKDKISDFNMEMDELESSFLDNSEISEFPINTIETDEFTGINLLTSFDAEKIPETSECMICYDTITNENVTIKCGHKYCVKCFILHMRTKNECAYCRQVINNEIPTINHINQIPMMTLDARREIIWEFIENSRNLISNFKSDFINHLESTIINEQSSDTEREMFKRIKSESNSANSTFSLIPIMAQIIQVTSEWYESDDAIVE